MKIIQPFNLLNVYPIILILLSLIGCVPYSDRYYSVEYGFMSSKKSTFLRLVSEPQDLYLSVRCSSGNDFPTEIKIVGNDSENVSFSVQPTIEFKNKKIQATKFEPSSFGAGKAYKLSFDISCEELNFAKLDLSSIKIADREYSIPSIFLRLVWSLIVASYGFLQTSGNNPINYLFNIFNPDLSSNENG